MKEVIDVHVCIILTNVLNSLTAAHLKSCLQLPPVLLLLLTLSFNGSDLFCVTFHHIIYFFLVLICKLLHVEFIVFMFVVQMIDNLQMVKALQPMSDLQQAAVVFLQMTRPL